MMARGPMLPSGVKPVSGNSTRLFSAASRPSSISPCPDLGWYDIFPRPTSPGTIPLTEWFLQEAQTNIIDMKEVDAEALGWAIEYMYSGRKYQPTPFAFIYIDATND